MDQEEMFEEKQRNTRLIWRILVVVIALIIVAVLAYPLIQQQLNQNNNAASVSVEQPVTEASTPEEWFELGKEYYQQAQWDQAVAAFQQVIDLDSNYQAAYANLGAAYHRQDKLDLAIAQYQMALELNPNDGEVVYNLAAVYIQQATQGGGQPDLELLNQAVEQLTHAQELSPQSAEPYFGLGVAYTALNQPDEAVDAFEVFLERDTGNDPRAKEEAERYLEFLRTYQKD